MTAPRARLVVGAVPEALAEFPDGHFDAVVTDPPYDLTAGKRGGSGAASLNLSSPAERARVTTGFMGKAWDGTGVAFDPATWREVLRVVKPGGHLVTFGGTRTHHRLWCAVEDAGFEIRDTILACGMLAWTFGTGFPKSADVARAIDRALGAQVETGNSTERCPYYPDECRGHGDAGRSQSGQTFHRRASGYVTEEAGRWIGWQTALRPAFEPILLARKPLDGTIASNVLRHGAGALNIEACRVHFAGAADEQGAKGKNRHADFGSGARGNAIYGADARARSASGNWDPPGRWPSDLVLVHAPECVRAGTKRVQGDARDHQGGSRPGGFGNVGADAGDGKPCGPLYGDPDGSERVDDWRCADGCVVVALRAQTGGDRDGDVSRFFPQFAYEADDFAPFQYVPKASRAEREMGCDQLPTRSGAEAVGRAEGSAGTKSPRAGASRTTECVHNTHPTVKPVALMQWLCRLVAAKGALILDPFAGSGTTGVAALCEGFRCVLVEQDEEYARIAEARTSRFAQLGLGL